ncbi:hypothetical protein B0T24DRAFT_615440, partial [Lasiosphaeria ovina]
MAVAMTVALAAGLALWVVDFWVAFWVAFLVAFAWLILAHWVKALKARRGQLIDVAFVDFGAVLNQMRVFVFL